MRRVAFVWLDQLGFQAPNRAAPPGERAQVLIALAAGGWRLMGMDGRARAAGLSPGQSLADARVLCPDLHAAPYQPQADAQMLARLARWCARFSPAVALDPPAGGAGGLYLDSFGVAHLFGGEAGHLDAIVAGLARCGFTARAAVADTPRAAAALACYGADRTIAPPGSGLAPLLDLPVAALAPAAAEALRALGLKRIGDLVRQPRASLARRFGPGLIDTLDAASGARADPADPLPAAQRFIALARFAEPILLLEQIETVIDRLAGELAVQLDEAASGARRLALRLYRTDGAALGLACGAARPVARADQIARLVRERLAARAERLDPGFGIEAMRLEALAVARLGAAAQDLDPAAAAQIAAHEAQAGLLDRLAARLGGEAVRRLKPHDSHIPERAVRAAAIEAAPAPFPLGAPRPLFLLQPPEPIAVIAQAPDGAPRRFRWRRVFHRVAAAAGPERIGAEWWRASAPTRDYYRIETQEGRRFWVFRNGLMGAEHDNPEWFLHGGFA
jgi:protein ImuB